MALVRGDAVSRGGRGDEEDEEDEDADVEAQEPGDEGEGEEVLLALGRGVDVVGVAAEAGDAGVVAAVRAGAARRAGGLALGVVVVHGDVGLGEHLEEVEAGYSGGFSKLSHAKVGRGSGRRV